MDNVFYLQCKSKLILVNRFLFFREVIVVIEIVRAGWIGMYLEECLRMWGLSSQVNGWYCCALRGQCEGEGSGITDGGGKEVM